MRPPLESLHLPIDVTSWTSSMCVTTISFECLCTLCNDPMFLASCWFPNSQCSLLCPRVYCCMHLSLSCILCVLKKDILGLCSMLLHKTPLLEKQSTSSCCRCLQWESSPLTDFFCTATISISSLLDFVLNISLYICAFPQYLLLQSVIPSSSICDLSCCNLCLSFLVTTSTAHLLLSHASPARPELSHVPTKTFHCLFSYNLQRFLWCSQHLLLETTQHGVTCSTCYTSPRLNYS